MPFVSYAQNFEDVILNRCFSERENGVYVDVGAAWPVSDSVTKAFYDKGWRGINIEPSRQLWELLVQERPGDENLNVAVSNENSEIDFYDVIETGLSTVDERLSTRYLKEGWKIEKYTVSCVTLRRIFSEHCNSSDIHVLKVDAEGHEGAVIESNDWEAFRPWVVLIESTIPLSNDAADFSWEDIILGNDYSYVYYDGLNRWYVAAEHRHLHVHFKVPPNVFDDFVRFRDYQILRAIQGEEFSFESSRKKIGSSFSNYVTVLERLEQAEEKLLHREYVIRQYSNRISELSYDPESKTIEALIRKGKIQNPRDERAKPTDNMGIDGAIMGQKKSESVPTLFAIKRLFINLLISVHRRSALLRKVGYVVLARSASMRRLVDRSINISAREQRDSARENISEDEPDNEAIVRIRKELRRLGRSV